ncbi:thiamine pyrophosphate-binding protein [Sphaerisporangium sp. NPDC051011]|uniref:thiamine pyrophosphate-binding protein n=1 Tax=Sphaerisporangium sp. NPDC051011 TaxID=3155792 RepID=UPI00340515D3
MSREAMGSMPDEPLFVDHLLEVLKANGVRKVFGLPGSAIGPLLQGLLMETGIDLIVSRHESGAVAMADGYARVTGGLGVAIVTSGPGALNALPHLAVANADNSPVLLISGEAAQARHGRGAFQESGRDGVDVVDAYRTCTAYSRSLTDPGSAVTLLDNALRHALSAPRGAVHLSVPVDLYSRPCPSPVVPGGVSTTWGPSVPDEAADMALTALLTASRPLILLGNGSRQALSETPSLGAEFVGFCARHGLPVATTTKAKGLFPEDQEEALGVVSIGGSARAHAYIERPLDTVLVLGSSLGEWASRNWTPVLQARDTFIHVDADPTRIGRSYRADVGITADIALFLRALLRADARRRGQDGHDGHGSPASRRAALRGLPPIHPSVPAEYHELTPVKPQVVMHHLREWLSQDAERILLLDAGNGTGWFTRQVPVSPPSRALLPWGMGSMGWANAAVVGAKAARPDLTCATITGDGGFLMNAVEIATATRQRLGAIWIVLQDDSFNTVRQGMNHAYPGSRHITDEVFRLGAPDLAGLARDLGAQAHSVDHPGQLAGALSLAEKLAFEECRPQVVRVHVDPDGPGPFDDRNDAVTDSFQIH